MKITFTMFGAIMLLSLSGYAFGEEAAEKGGVSAAASKAVDAGNKICPVSGEKIPVPGEKGAMGEAVHYEYNGKIYNLCCSMCVRDFKKNPEKYSKIADEEAAKEQEAQEENKEDKSIKGE